MKILSFLIETSQEHGVDVAEKIHQEPTTKIWWYWLGYAFVFACVAVGIFLLAKYFFSVIVPSKIGNPVNEDPVNDVAEKDAAEKDAAELSVSEKTK